MSLTDTYDVLKYTFALISILNSSCLTDTYDVL